VIVRIVRFALAHRGLVLVLAALLAGVGLVAGWTAPRDTFPEFAPPIVEIQAEAPGFSSLDVEQLVLTPLERALAGVPGVERLRSTAAPGLAVVSVVFGYGRGPDRCRQLVMERVALARSQLPAGVEPAVAPPTSSLSFLLAVGLSGEASSPMALRDLAEWTIRPRLLAVRGVANVVVYGGRVREVQLRTTPERLVAAHVTIDDVESAVRVATGTASGYLDAPGQRALLDFEGRPRTGAELASSSITTADGRQLPLARSVEVIDGPALAVGEANIQAKPGVLLLLMKSPGANVIAVTREAEHALAALAQSLPAGVELQPELFRQASFVDHAFENVRRAVLLSGVLVVLVLLASLGDVRAALVSVVAIPLSLLVAVLGLRAFGLPLDVMALGGLAVAVGSVVDDAILDAERALRRLRAAGPGVDLDEEIVNASRDVRSGVVHATWITALVFLPVFLLGGLEGALFRPLATAYLLAMGASLAVALVVTPCLAALLFPGTVRRHPTTPRPIARLEAAYVRGLATLLHHPRRVLVLGTLAPLALLGLAAQLRFEFLPPFRETNFVLHMAGAPGVGLDETARVGRAVSERLLAIPGVRFVSQFIGRSGLAEDATFGAEESELLVRLADDADPDAALAAIETVTAGVRGFAFDAKQFLNERIEETLEGETAPIVARLRGVSLSQLEHAARELAVAIGAVEAVASVKLPEVSRSPGWQIRLRRGDMARLGVSSLSIERSLRSALGGLPIGQLSEQGRVRSVSLRSEPEHASEASWLSRLPIAAPGRRVVLLGDVADVHPELVRSQLQHEDGVRTVALRIAVSGRSLDAVFRDIEALLRGASLPDGVYAELRGEYQAARAARQRLAGLGCIALVGALAILWFEFRSLPPALLVLLNVPLSLSGGIAALVLAGDARFSLGSAVGLVTLLGISLRNGIVLVDHLRAEAAQSVGPRGARAVAEAAGTRLLPILMTAGVTAASLLPLLWLGTRAGGELEQPIALVTLGGLATSTLLNLLLMPAWFALPASPRSH
jgi:CzcA family heavy metal efflux pump